MPDGRVLASTVDIFTPVVDDPHTYGAIAAANSLSDLYAMGARPVFGLSILGYPPDLLSPYTAAGIIQGAIDKSWEAGVVVAGGHTIKTTEIMFGLSVVGEVNPDELMTKGGARPGDLLVLTKPLGIGLLTTALKRGMLEKEEVDAVVFEMMTLNRTAAEIAVECKVRACTDVTGFGFLGHLGEMVRASKLRANVSIAAVPALGRSLALASDGVIPGGTLANLEFSKGLAHFDPAVPYEKRVLLADAQTSGGLILAVPPGSYEQFEELCNQQGQTFQLVGSFENGEPGIDIS